MRLATTPVRGASIPVINIHESTPRESLASTRFAASEEGYDDVDEFYSPPSTMDRGQWDYSSTSMDLMGGTTPPVSADDRERRHHLPFSDGSPRLDGGGYAM